jgi:hypothetical protein
MASAAGTVRTVAGSANLLYDCRIQPIRFGRHVELTVRIPQEKELLMREVHAADEEIPQAHRDNTGRWVYKLYGLTLELIAI